MVAMLARRNTVVRRDLPPEVCAPPAAAACPGARASAERRRLMAMLRVRKEGRRHHYTVNLDAPFKHPVVNGVSLRVILGELVAHALRDDLVAARTA